MEMLGLQGLLGLQVEQDRTSSGLIKNLANRTARKCLNVPQSITMKYTEVLPTAKYLIVPQST